MSVMLLPSVSEKNMLFGCCLVTGLNETLKLKMVFVFQFSETKGKIKSFTHLLMILVYCVRHGKIEISHQQYYVFAGFDGTALIFSHLPNVRVVMHLITLMYNRL